MKKHFLAVFSLVLLFGCADSQKSSCFSVQGMSDADKKILSKLRTTTLKNVVIQTPDLPTAMETLNKLITEKEGYPNGISYVIQGCGKESYALDPFAVVTNSSLFVGRSVSVKIDKASLKDILIAIASQSGYKIKLSNGIVFEVGRDMLERSNSTNITKSLER